MVAFVIIILVLISGILAVQIATDSTLILRVKQFLRLEQPYPKKLNALSKFWTWWVFIPRWFVILSPFIAIIILVLKLHQVLSELLDCPYCTAFHIMWMLCFFFVGIPIIPSLVLAPLGILGVYIIEALRK